MRDWFHKKFIVKLLELEDPPEKVARGIAVGTFVSITPTGGIQTLIAIILATIMRGNRLAAALFTWLSNPITMVPVCWVNYTIGAILLGAPFLGWHEIRKLVELESTSLIAKFFEFLGNLAHNCSDASWQHNSWHHYRFARLLHLASFTEEAPREKNGEETGERANSCSGGGFCCLLR